MKSVILVITSVFLFGLFATDTQAAEDYNSSRSNTSTAIADVDIIDQRTLDRVRTRIDQAGSRINEVKVLEILKEFGITRYTNIVLERKDNKVEIYILKNRTDLRDAKKALVRGADDTPQSRGDPLKGLNISKADKYKKNQ